MNEDKTEILFCDPKNLCPLFVKEMKVTIDNNKIDFASNARNLGVYFDCNLSFEYHIDQLCRISCVELRRIGHISRYLDKESVNKLVCSFIFSRIDYCNSLFYGLPKYFLDKLQRIQNHAAR